ncbi:MAG TPA: hypothetical protein VL101_04795, partial [Nordella sp.]|nr:hypothetical protein [Nordella sp.]
MSKRGGKTKNRPEGDGAVRFTYSTSDQPLLQRTVIQAIEKIGGQAKLKKLYDRRNADRRPGESFFAAALRLLKINVEIDRAALDLCPAEGPVVFIANHPYGVLDGISLTWASILVRPDIKVLANSVLC